MMLGRLKFYATMLALGAISSGCTTAVMPVGVSDPYETLNRATYSVNKGLDKALVRPASQVYGAVVPNPVRQGVSNVADTLSIPGAVANDLFQLNIPDAFHNTARFAINATIGIAGLLDVASEIGIEERDSDFGETLHTWGVGEGNYVVLPVYGASTERDTVGLAVDWLIDPVGQLVDLPETRAVTGVRIAKLTDDRYRFDDLINSVLYDSADGYAQLRLTYLDNRRFALGQTQSVDAGEENNSSYSIYEDFYD